MDRLSIPYLIPTQTFVLEYEFDGAVTGTPTWELFVDGASDGAASNGSQVSGNLYRFDITPTAAAKVGKSARIRLTANVGGAIFVDVYSVIAQTAKLIELDKSYRHTQDAIDANAKTADVTITETS